jgi:hypothetical protein
VTAVFSASDFSRLRGLAAKWQGERRPRAADDLNAVLDEIGARREAGGDVFGAKVYAESIPGLRDAALAEAMALWGEKVEPEVETVGAVHPASGRPGRFFAYVYVRCLNYAEIAS